MNILYFVCHDLGRRLGCYGTPYATPQLDRFAAESVVFTQAFCSSPACTPSRACAMTGRYPHHTGCLGLSHHGWPLDPRERTIVDDLNDAGYETILSGVNHERHPRTDRYQVDLTRTWADWGAERAVNHAVAHLEKRDRSRPFYLNIGVQEPHGSTWKEVGKRIPGPVPPKQVVVPHGFPDTAAIREEMGRFQAASLHMDAQFGRLMAALDRLGLRENTLVVFTTDHGIAGPNAKGTLYDLGMETALLVRTPDGRGAGTRSDALLPNIDLRPTLNEAAGRPVPAECDGRSFWPLLAGGAYTRNAEIFTERNYHGVGRDEAYDPSRALRTERWHYIRWYRPEHAKRGPRPWELPDDGRADAGFPAGTTPRAKEELYQIDQDPREWIDLAARPEYAAIKAELSARLDRWMRETGDFLPNPPPFRALEDGWGEGWPLEPS